MYKKFFFFSIITAFFLHACKSGPSAELPAANVKSLPFTELELKDLDNFEPVQSDEWKIAGGVYMNRHDGSKVEKGEGSGMLCGQLTSSKTSSIVTKLKHGDLDLTLDFMVAKGAVASIWLQGRYKISISDSWNLDSVNASDNGGVSLLVSKDSMGFPLLNASKAPGLWQHLSLSFKSARFDEKGNKTTAAILTNLSINGKSVQKDLALPSVSKNSFSSDESKDAALIFSLEKGASALKNIRYKDYHPQYLTLKDMRFDIYKGLYKNYDTIKNFKPYKSGTTDSLTWRVGEKRAELVIKGSINITHEGVYLFRIRGGGAAAIVIDEKEVASNQGTREYTNAYTGSIQLSAGDHPFALYHANYDECLVLDYEGPGIPFTTLTTPASERKVAIVPALEIAVNREPVMQRGFMIHHDKVDPYAVTTGFPQRVNYAYDLSSFSLLYFWRGKYVDASDMWVERGEPQLQKPLGAAVELQGLPSVFNTDATPGIWLDSVIVDANVYTNRRYSIDSLGIPVYSYEYRGAQVEDRIMPGGDGLTREIRITKTTGNGQPGFLLGGGSLVEKLPDGSFAIDNKEFYIEFPDPADAAKVIITKFKNGTYGLLWKANPDQSPVGLKYSLIW